MKHYTEENVGHLGVGLRLKKV